MVKYYYNNFLSRNFKNEENKKITEKRNRGNRRAP
jgi:hypothetical protein